VRASAANTLASGSVSKVPVAVSRTTSSESAARMVRNSTWSSGESEAAPLQMASLRSRVARPDLISSRNPSLMVASHGSLQILSREGNLARLTGRTNWSERLSIHFEQQCPSIAS
jgi:hypothetical protein